MKKLRELDFRVDRLVRAAGIDLQPRDADEGLRRGLYWTDSRALGYSG